MAPRASCLCWCLCCQYSIVFYGCLPCPVVQRSEGPSAATIVYHLCMHACMSPCALAAQLSALFPYSLGRKAPIVPMRVASDHLLFNLRLSSRSLSGCLLFPAYRSPCYAQTCRPRLDPLGRPCFRLAHCARPRDQWAAASAWLSPSSSYPP